MMEIAAEAFPGFSAGGKEGRKRGRPRSNQMVGAKRMAITGMTSMADMGSAHGVAFDDAVGTLLAREDDHGHTAAGVGTTTGKVEVFIAAARLGCFEAVVQFPIGDDTIDRSSIRPIHALNVDGGEQVFNHDALSEASQAAAFHLINAPVLEGNVVFVGDVGAVLQRWDMGQDLDVVTTLGGFAGIGACGSDDVKGGVLR